MTWQELTYTTYTRLIQAHSIPTITVAWLVYFCRQKKSLVNASHVSNEERGLIVAYTWQEENEPFRTVTFNLEKLKQKFKFICILPPFKPF